MKMFHIVLLVVVAVLFNSLTYAASFTFDYKSWNTTGYGELFGTETENGWIKLTSGYLTDSEFGKFELAKGSTFTNYLISDNGAFHYTNLINTGNDIVFDMFGLLFTDNSKRQLNLWGFDFNLWGVDIEPLYTICIYDNTKYIWSSFIDLNVSKDAAAPVPEPSTALLFGAGIMLLARVRRP